MLDPRQREKNENASTRGSPRRERSGEMERKRTVLHGLDELEEWLDAPIQAILEEIRDVQKLDKNSYMLNGETKNSEKIVIELFFEDESRIVVQEKNAVINLSKKDALEIWNRLGPAPWVR